MVEVIIRDSRGLCPKCSGMMGAILPMVSYQCIDCGAVFTAIGNGYSENGVLVREEAECD
jgi:DNA-directed RNA polymerase subunit RPC12/RpoP